MLQITYANDRFEVKVITDDREEFQEEVNYLKRLYLSYDKDNYVWYYDWKKIDEVHLWMKEFGVEIDYSYTAVTKIKEFKSEYYKKEIVRGRNRFDQSILNEGIVPYKFQINIINHHLGQNRVWDCLDAGLGKSFINISYFSQLNKQGKIDKIFIIVPIGMSYHWKYEILRFVNLFKEEDILIVENKNKKRIFDIEENKNKKIIIISNHILSDMLLSYKKTKTNKKKNVRWKKFLDFKKEWGADNLFLLVDESHQFKHTSSIRTKALNSIIDDFEYRSFLTATPFIQKIEHAYSNTIMLDKSIIPMSENGFKLWLSDKIGNKFDPYAIISYNSGNVNHFLNSLQTIFIKINKEDVPEMKYERILKRIYLKMTPIQQKIYYRITKTLLCNLEEEYDNITWKQILNLLPTILQVIDSPLMLKNKTFGKVVNLMNEFGEFEEQITEDIELNLLIQKFKTSDDPKLNLLDSKLKDYIEDNNEKVIVFCQYPSNLDYFYKKYQKYNPIVIHGQTEGKDKERIRDEKRRKFNSDKDCKLALLSFLTSSAGGNWQEQCHRMLFYSLPWDVTLSRQALDRTHRINSTDNTIVEIFNYPESLDNLRYERSLNRINLNDKLGEKIKDEEFLQLLEGIL